MAGRQNPSFQKRLKEQKRKDRAEAKREERRARRAARAAAIGQPEPTGPDESIADAGNGEAAEEPGR